jgi:hypothetical protein
MVGEMLLVCAIDRYERTLAKRIGNGAMPRGFSEVPSLKHLIIIAHVAPITRKESESENREYSRL